MKIKPSLEITADALKWFNALLRAAQQGIVSERFVITPERAAVLLSRNEQNRNIRPTKSAQYEADMRAGRFRFNGEAIIVSREGLLNDGQHRLHACIAAGVGFETMLVVGVERDSRYTIDTGTAKGAGDHLAFQGVANSNTAAAIARSVIAWERDGNLGRRAQISTMEQIDRVKEDALIREIATWTDNSRHRLKNMAKGSVVGLVFYILSSKRPLDAKTFMEAFRTGANLSASSAIYQLRDKLMMSDDLSEMDKIELFVRAWNRWLVGDESKQKMLRKGVIPTISDKVKPGVVLA
jgi:hypothetical protein